MGKRLWGGFIGGIYGFRRPCFSKIADIDIVLDGHGSRSVVGRAVQHSPCSLGPTNWISGPFETRLADTTHRFPHLGGVSDWGCLDEWQLG